MKQTVPEIVPIPHMSYFYARRNLNSDSLQDLSGSVRSEP